MMRTTQKPKHTPAPYIDTTEIWDPYLETLKTPNWCTVASLTSGIATITMPLRQPAKAGVVSMDHLPGFEKQRVIKMDQPLDEKNVVQAFVSRIHRFQ